MPIAAFATAATAAPGTPNGPPPASLLSILSSPSVSDLHQSLRTWNDEIEATNFGPASLGLGGGDSTGTTTDQLLEQVPPASEALCEVMVREILSNPKALACGCGTCGPWSSDHNEDDEADDDETENAPARDAARSIRRYRRLGRTDDNESSGSSAEDSTVQATASEALRCIKNLVRYTNTVQMMLGMDRRLSARPEEDVVSTDPLRQLRHVDMLRVYLEVFVGCCCPSPSSSAGAGRADTKRDDAARNASLALFHTTYGAPDANPAATRARTLLVKQVGFIPYLMSLLCRASTSSNTAEDGEGDDGNGKGEHLHQQLELPPPLLLSLTRHVHSLVGCDPKVVPEVNRAIQSVGTESNARGAQDLVSVLVSVLSVTVLAGEGAGGTLPFPGTEVSDRRPDLATEILRVLFALRATGAVADPSAPTGDGDESESTASSVGFDTMTRIGELACLILKLPPLDRSLSTKLAAVNLLMDAPRGYASYLLNEGAIPSLLLILRCQIDEVIERRTGSFNGDAATLVPILAVLDRLSADDSAVQGLVKSEIFPPSEEEAYQVRAAEERAKGGGGRNGLNAKNMQPALEASPGTLRWKMIRLMTWPESNVKRCVSELLWRLCDGDATEFVLRVGFGNAVHMLGIKGLVQVPTSSFG